VNLRVYCPSPECKGFGRVAPPDLDRWSCPLCDQVVILAHPRPDPSLPCCAACGCAELYKKKDFPHALGMGVLVGAFLASTVFYYWYRNVVTWGILIGSAAFDGILYLLVKDVIVCYRCGAEHRGVMAGPEHRPFELTIHERYRQERLRKEQFSSGKRGG
jgi:hypothetical protein